MMMLTKRLKKLHALINKSIEIDNTQYERELEKKDERQIFLEKRKSKTEYYSIEMKLNIIIREKQRNKSRREASETKKTFQVKKLRDKIKMICYECDKLEHYKRDCRFKFKKKLEEEQFNMTQQLNAVN